MSMPAAAALILFLVMLLIAAHLLTSALFLLLGARIAQIPDRSFGRALGITVLGGIASLLLSSGGFVAPVIGFVSGAVLGLLAQALIAMPIFKTTFGKALAATLLATVLQWASVLIGVLIALLFFGGAIQAALNSL